jgi:hypothetical protein
MRRFVVLVAALGAAALATFIAWRRNPRIGSATMNAKVNPILIRRGLSGGGRAEIGTLEHVGRRSGTRRLTPIHPVATAYGFRIVVPLGDLSEWARNVIAAGHCRLQLHDTVYGLDEPVLLDAWEMGELSAAGRWIGRALGIKYLRLHRFEERAGALETVEAVNAVEVAATAPASGGSETNDLAAGDPAEGAAARS